MEFTRAEENRNRVISAGLTLLICTALLLFLILFSLIRPNPPFPEGGGGGGQELALGLLDVGNDRLDFTSMGAVTDVVVQKTSPKEQIVTVEGGEDVPVTKEKPRVTENKMVITPVPPKPEVKSETEAEKLAKKFKRKASQSGGGIGDNNEEGASGSPEGDPFKSGTGGSGTGTGGGDGVGEGPGSGPGSNGRGGGFSYGLSGRKLLQMPQLPKDTKEEGKVVVEIVVDAEGNVIEASPTGRGTTTSSPMLKAKARMAALATKFNPDARWEEQRGTITIVFQFN